MRTLTPLTRRALARRGLLAFELAILLAGGQGKLAELIGSTDQKVSHWKLRDLAVPVAWAPRIAAALRHPLITVYTLRPDQAEFWDLLAAQLGENVHRAILTMPEVNGELVKLVPTRLPRPVRKADHRQQVSA
jgi:DNA-binding transcriptional regulator YdaS (Cro superfamily)